MLLIRMPQIEIYITTEVLNVSERKYRGGVRGGGGYFQRNRSKQSEIRTYRYTRIL